MGEGYTRQTDKKERGQEGGRARGRSKRKKEDVHQILLRTHLSPAIFITIQA